MERAHAGVGQEGPAKEIDEFIRCKKQFKKWLYAISTQVLDLEV